MRKHDYEDLTKWWPVAMAAEAVPVKCCVGTIHNWGKAGHFEIRMKDLRSAVVNVKGFVRYLKRRWPDYVLPDMATATHSTA